MATPAIPFAVYVKSSDGKFGTPTSLSNLIGSGLEINSTSGKIDVIPQVVPVAVQSIAESHDFVTNPNNLLFTATKTDGSTSTFGGTIVNNLTSTLNASNVLTLDVNGVQTTVDLSTFAVDINVDTFTWDNVNYILTLTETDGTSTQLDLSGLVAVSVENSITGTGTQTSKLALVNDQSAPGNSYHYGTNASGVKGWYADNQTAASLSATAVTAVVTEDIPLEGYGDVTKAMYAPNKWVTLTDAAGVPLKGTNGKNLVVPAYELP